MTPTMMKNSAKQSCSIYEKCYALPFRYFIADDGTELHGGGLCCDGVWIKESGLFPSSLATYEFDSKDVKYVDDEAVFIGYMSPVWGHAITDCLKHLWWLNTEDYQKKHKKKDLYYWGPRPLSGNFLELVRLAGVEVNKLHFIDEKLLFRSVIVPDISFNYSEGWASKEYLDTIDLIITNIKPYCDRNKAPIFLSERESRRTCGVRSIEKVARSAGYKVYYPGEHSLRDQISVLRSASLILSFESSVGHNTIFCHPQTKLIMLRKEEYANRYQSLINKLWGFVVTTVDASLSIMNDKRFPYAGPFFVYPNDAVCQAMVSCLPQKSKGVFSRHCRYKQESTRLFPKKAFKQYIEYNLWGDKDVLANRFVFSDTQAKRISHEITKYRECQYERIGKLFRFVLLPQGIKDRIISKITKYKVRHLI